MKCFIHEAAEAVGVCKHCSKGLCADCAVDLGHGLACREHQGEVEAVRAMLLSVRLAQASNRKHMYVGPLFLFAFGALFFFWGLFNPNRASAFSMVLGAGLLVFAIVVLHAIRSASGKGTAA